MSTSGSENGTGFSDSPFSSIQDAIDASSNGDTILVSAGTYTENIILNKSVLLNSEEGAVATIIDGGGSGTVVTMNPFSTAAYYGYPDIHADPVLDGFTIQNGSVLRLKLYKRWSGNWCQQFSRKKLYHQRQSEP